MASRNLLNFWKYPRKFLLFKNSIYSMGMKNIHQISSSFAMSQINMHQLNHHGPILFNSANYSTKISTVFDQKQLTIDFEHQLLEKLRNELSTTGFVNVDTLSKAIESLAFNITDVESNFLLDCCASIVPSANSENKFELFNKIWNAINKNGKPTKDNYLKTAKVFKENKISSEYFQKLLNECPFKDDIEIYEGLMQLIAQSGNIERANKLITEMRNKNLKLTENLFHSLILAYSKNGNLKECKNVLESMNATNLLPNTETYTELIIAHIQNDDVEGVHKLLLEHGKHLKTTQIIEVIRNAALKNMKSIVEKCFKYDSHDFQNVKEVPLSLRKICNQLIYEGHPDEAFLIVNSFPKPIFNEKQNIDTFGVFIIFEFIKSNQPVSKTVEICHELITSEKNSRALHIACEIVLRKQLENSLEYLKALSELEPLRSHYFWPIFLQRFCLNGETGILDTIKIMNQYKIDFDYETISMYILPRLTITLTDEQKTIKILENCGLKTNEIMTPLIVHMLFQQKFNEAISILELYQTKINTENLIYPLMHNVASIKATKKYQELCKLLETLVKKSHNPNYDFIGHFLIEIIDHQKFKNDLRSIKMLINDFQKTTNLKISRAAADIILGNQLQYETELKSLIHKMIDSKLNLPSTLYNNGSFIRHPRDMNLDELECHLIELESKNLNSRGVLRRLLQMCIKEGKLERALELKDKCDKLKVQVSPGMMASIFDMYIKLKKLNEAEKYFHEIKKVFPGFLLDEHKIIDFASLLVENGRLEDAKQILKERTKIIGGDYVQKNIWQLLTNIANQSLSNDELKKSNSNQTKDMFNLLYNLGYCIPHNTILGPIIREYILRKDIKSAVNEYKIFVTEYKKTPLQFELMSILVKLMNTNNESIEYENITKDEAKNLLQDIVTLTVNVHGNVNTNGCLLLAIADSGTDGQLRKLLIDPNFRFNEDTLIKNCEHLSNIGKIHVLLKLAKASRGLRHATIKEQNLYNILLNNFIKENNCELALKLYNKLIDDDELKISQEFINNLINLLKVNNYQIPSSLALKAHIM